MSYQTHRNFRQVGRIFGLSHQTVQYIVHNDSNRVKAKRGPKFRLSRDQELAIRREVRRRNSEGIQVKANSIREACSIKNLTTDSVRLNMKRLGFVYTHAKQAILLTRNHKQRRVALAKQWLKDSQPWNITVFSDEKKFNLDGPDNWSTYTDEGRKLYRNKRQMGGGSVMVWAMLLPNLTLHIERLEGSIDSDLYVQMLSSVVPILDNLLGRDSYIFQQDNAPIHTSKRVREFFVEAEVRVLEWPARSPDLNIIENVWSMLSSIVYEGKQFSSTDDLWNAIQEATFELMFKKSTQLQNLYDDMNQRLIDVIEAKGAKINR